MFNKKILQITIFIVSIVIFKKKNNKNNRLRPDDTADNTLTILMVLSVQVRVSGSNTHYFVIIVYRALIIK